MGFRLNDRAIRAAALPLLAVTAAVVGSWWPGAAPAGAVEHPEIEITEVDMVPERGWGVSDQDPSTTQTETLDVLVWDMVQSGDRMFVGGAFLNVKSGSNATPISQPYLAAFDVATGDWVDTFRPTFDRAIYALEVLPNGSVLVGGEFETVNGTTRRGLVALDEITGEIDPTFAGAVDRPWSSRRATVRDMKVEPDSGFIYVAGNFSHFDGAGGSRTQTSKAGRFLNAAGVLDASWKPIVSGGAVWGLDTDTSRGEVALSGWFTSVNSQLDSGHFHIVDDQTGAAVPGKLEVPNSSSSQNEVYDVVYGDDIIFRIGEQHMVQVLNSDNHQRLGYHTTGTNSDGFTWTGGFAGGAYQAGERIGDIIITGCHCTRGTNNHYESFTDRRTSRFNVMAYDAITGRHIEEFDADIDSPRDGHWAAASDDAGCLWIGGDYHVGGNEAGTPRWVGGFARLCMPVPPIRVTDPGSQLNQVGQPVSLQIEASGGRGATLLYSATELPSGLFIDPFTGLITGTTDELDVDTVTVNVEVAAGEGLPSSVIFEWAIMDGQAPVLDPVDDQAVTEFSPIDIPLRATDAEGSDFIWSAQGLPAGLAIDQGMISGSAIGEGEYTVTVTVVDPAGLSDRQSFNLTVIDRPTTAAISSLENHSYSNGSYFLGFQIQVDKAMNVTELGVHDSDRNGQITNVGATTVALYDQANQQELARVDVPAGTPIENNFAYAPLDQPVNLSPGKTYVLAAESSGEPYSRDGNITLAPDVRIVGYAWKSGVDAGYPANQGNQNRNRYIGPTFRTFGDNPAPLLQPIADQLGQIDTPVSVRPSATSPAGRPLTWAALGLPGGVAIDAATGELSGTPLNGGIFQVSVTVTDDVGLTDTESFAWTIADTEPPTIAPLSNQSAGEYTTVSIQPQLVAADPGVRWSAEGLPDGLNINSTTGLITGVATPDGAYSITLTATDAIGLIDTELFVLTVTGRSTTNVITAHSGYSHRGGDFFLGWSFRVDEVMEMSELGIFDADGNGQITNNGATTIALYDDATTNELVRVDVPVGTPVDGGYAWAPLAEPYQLQPGTDYTIAAGVNGEDFARNGSMTFVDGVTATGRAYKSGSDPGYPNVRSDTFRTRFFGPSFRVLDPVDDNGGGPIDDDSLLPAGTVWRYDDSGADLGDAWSAPDFDDAAWASSRAEFGFGEGDETTTWTSGSVTYYARTQFEFSGQTPPSLKLDLKADDGAVVYLNGVEILRDNMPEGRINFDTTATTWRSGADEDFMLHIVDASALVEGTNVVAVEVHNTWANNADLSFDLSLASFDAVVEPPETDLVSDGSTWTYTNSANGEPADWKQGIVGGQTGDAEFGFGDDDEVTPLTPGEEAYYFTKTFDLDNAAGGQLELGLAADDGAVVYLNGVEIHRFNMPAGPVSFDTRPVTWKSGSDERMQTTTVAGDALVAGTNVIAVEVHNLWPGNNDLSFDLRLRPVG